MSNFARHIEKGIACQLVLVLTTSVFAAPIHDAVKAGKMAESKRLIAKNPSDANAQDNWGFTPLMYAVRENRLDLVEMLLKNGARVSVKDSMARENALDKARLYLRRCGDEYLKQQIDLWKLQNASEDQISQRTAAHKSSYGEETRQKLLKIEEVLSEAFRKELVSDQESPLLSAVVQGRTEEVMQLLEKGGNIEVKDKDGRTPLLLAVMHGHMRIAKLLLDRGADMAEPDKDGQTAFLAARQMFELFVTATRDRDYEYVRSELKKGKLDINAKDKNGETPLLRAAAEGRLEDVNHLLQLGARSDLKNAKGQSLQELTCTRHPHQLRDQILKSIAEASDGVNQNAPAKSEKP